MPKRSLAAILLAAFVLILGLVAAGCGDDEEEPTGGSGTAQEEEKPAIKVGLVTDIGGLNDRSFNQLANEGLERAKSELGVEGRALTSESDADYVPNLSTLAQQKYDLVIGVGFLMSDAVNTVAKQFPDTNFAIIDFPQAGLKDKPANVRGLLFKENEAGYLVGYLAALVVKEKGGDQVISSVGGQKIPPVDAYIAGYQAGAKAATARHQDAQRLLAGLRRPGEVQGDRAQPDRGGLAGRLPGRRPVRPRRARRGQGEGRARHRRRRRPGLPGRSHPDLGAEEGRRRRVRDRQGGPGRHLRGRRGPGVRPQATTASGSASSTPTARRSPTRWRRSSSRSSTARSPTSRRRSSSRNAEDHADARRRTRPRAARDHEAVRLVGRERRDRLRAASAARSTRCSGRTGPASRRLMNVLYGLHHPDEGEIRLDGEPVTIDSARKAIGLGIGMVHQHFMLVPVMTVAENLVLGTEPSRGPLLDYKEAVRRARELSRAVRARDPPGGQGRGPRRRRPAARGDPPRAVPRRQGAGARRADRRAHRAGVAGPVQGAAHADGGRDVGRLHLAQAQRGARHRRPRDRPAARQEDRHGADRGRHRAQPGHADGRSRRAAAGRQARAHAGRAGARGARPARGRRPRAARRARPRRCRCGPARSSAWPASTPTGRAS